jgi:TnpA family transposase
MPRRSILSATEREQLLALPKSPEEFIRQYPSSEADLSLIHQHRGAANRLGFAVQLFYLRFPGMVLGVDHLPASSLLALVAAQLKLSVSEWAVYGQREQTRRKHLLEL